MKIKKFSHDQGYKFSWDGISATSYSSKEDFENASAIMFEVDGSHGKVKSTVSDRVYYVVEGSGIFIAQAQKIEVVTSDVVIVPKNTTYDYFGKMKLFLVHVPAYDPAGEMIIEKKKGRED